MSLDLERRQLQLLESFLISQLSSWWNKSRCTTLNLLQCVNILLEIRFARHTRGEASRILSHKNLEKGKVKIRKLSEDHSENFIRLTGSNLTLTSWSHIIVISHDTEIFLLLVQDYWNAVLALALRQISTDISISTASVGCLKMPQSRTPGQDQSIAKYSRIPLICILTILNCFLLFSCFCFILAFWKHGISNR